MQVALTKETINTQYTLVSDDERMEFLPKHFGDLFQKFESLLFTVASKTIKGYNGGYWEFATTEDAIPFAFPRASEPLTVTTMFGTSEAQIPTQIAGILCTALATLIMAERAKFYGISEDQTEQLIDLYYNLVSTGRNFAEDCDCEQEYFRLVD